MKSPNFIARITYFVLLCSFPIILNSCSTDDDDNAPEIEVMVNGEIVFDNGDDFMGDVDGDFKSNGGSGTRVFVWNNNLNTADFNADITATAVGSFRMVVRDADGVIVLDRTLMGNSEPDSISGVTDQGVSGLWSVSIVLTDFKGDGSFSLSEGN